MKKKHMLSISGRLPLALLLLLLLSVQASRPLTAQVDSSDWNAEQLEVWRTVLNYSAAAHRRDLDAYLTWFHPDFTGWHSGDDGPTDKAERSAGLTWYFANSVSLKQNLVPMAVQVIDGRVALVHYKSEETLRFADGKEYESVAHWTDILLKEKERWLIYSDHGGGTGE